MFYCTAKPDIVWFDLGQFGGQIRKIGLWQIAVFILASLAAMTSAFMTIQVRPN